MQLFQNKKDASNNSIKDDARRSNMLQWGAVVAVFVIVIMIMVINFCVISRNEAGYAVKDDLIIASEKYAKQIATELEMSMCAANTVAAIMSDEERYSVGDTAWYAQELKKMQSNVYQVIIADNEGVGFTSDMERVNISEMDYFAISRDPRYFITEDDGITHRRAYVMSVPYYHDNISKGTIYMFMSAESIAGIIPMGGYDLAASFVLCDTHGEVLAKAGTETAFLENDDLVSNLEKATFADDYNNAERVVNRFGNMAKFTFEAEYKGESKFFVSVPLGIGRWQYVTILNQQYVDRMIATGWAEAKAMTIELAIAVVLFISMIVVIVVLNRIQNNQRNQELADKADTDLLTGLNNKIATERKIQEYLDRNPDKQCLFFLFDIDNFKKINDTLGHAFGDEVLRSLGKQLSNEFRVTDIIGRTGGDEFILFLKDVNDEIIEKEATRFANFFRSFKAGEYVKYSATSSIGATVYPRDAKDYHGLYTTADSALYEAKRQGKNRMVFYNKGLKEVSSDAQRVTPIDSDAR